MLIDNENYQNLQFFKANGFRKLKEQLNRSPGESRIIQFVALANGMLGAFVETVEPVVKVKVKDELAEESSSPLAEDIFFVLNQVLKFLATLTISVLSVQHKVRSNRQIGFNQSSKPR